jgi:hypothetical protein
MKRRFACDLTSVGFVVVATVVFWPPKRMSWPNAARYLKTGELAVACEPNSDYYAGNSSSAHCELNLQLKAGELRTAHGQHTRFTAQLITDLCFDHSDLHSFPIPPIGHDCVVDFLKIAPFVWIGWFSSRAQHNRYLHVLIGSRFAS